MSSSEATLTGDMRQVLLAQSGYYVATGAFPYCSRRAFEAVTGPKREWWLVLTVGGLVTVVGAGLGRGARRGQTAPEIIDIASGCAAVLAGIDIAFVARRRIAPTYLIDAAAQLALLGALGVARARS
jgi:hypothetical protein